MAHHNHSQPSYPCTVNDVFFFLPNLIGYGRVVCTFSSLLLMMMIPQLWQTAIILYILSFVGDLVDGYAARKFNQSSEFGGMLDMITDRCSTLGILFVLSCEYRQQDGHGHGGGFLSLLFSSLAILDISSHWAQMFSVASLKLHHKSKEANAQRFFLVRWFYGVYPFFGYCCVGTEFTYIILYVLSHVQNNTSFTSLHHVCTVGLHFFLPAFFVKQIVNLFQLTSACHAVALNDALVRNQKGVKK